MGDGFMSAEIRAGIPRRIATSVATDNGLTKMPWSTTALGLRGSRSRTVSGRFLDQAALSTNLSVGTDNGFTSTASLTTPRGPLSDRAQTVHGITSRETERLSGTP